MSDVNFGNGKGLRYVWVAVFSVAATLFLATVVRSFVFGHPVASIVLGLVLIPAILPFNKMLMPYARVFLKRYAFVVIPSVLVTLSLLSLTRYFILALLLFLHAAMSIFLRQLKRNHIGIEIVTFITVVSGVAYGAKVGAITGALAMLLDYVFSARISYFSVVTIPAYALVGALSSFFSGVNIVVLGLAMTVAYNLFTWMFILGFMGGNLGKCLRFGFTGLAFNALMFSSFGAAMVMFMS